MGINTGAVRGGMWTSLDDDSPIHCRIERDTDFAEFNFLGSFEISLGMTEKTLVRCRDMFTKALQDMHATEDDQDQSWMHMVAPTD